MREIQLRDAKATLSAVVDEAVNGNPSVITRHGKPVAELRSRAPRNAKSSRAMLEWLLARTQARKSVGITSVELLNQMYEEDKE